MTSELDSSREAMERAGHRIDTLEAQLRDLREALAKETGSLVDLRKQVQNIADYLDKPKGLHTYTKGLHSPDCAACELRRWVRSLLPKTRALLAQQPAEGAALFVSDMVVSEPKYEELVEIDKDGNVVRKGAGTHPAEEEKRS